MLDMYVCKDIYVRKQVYLCVFVHLSTSMYMYMNVATKAQTCCNVLLGYMQRSLAAADKQPIHAYT